MFESDTTDESASFDGLISMSRLAKGVALMVLIPITYSACAPAITRPALHGFSLQVADNTKDSRFDIFLSSRDRRPLCISAESWPNSLGHFTVENEGVFVEIDDAIVPAQSALSSAYCPGGCGAHRIEPGETLTGIIAYNAFAEPERILGSSKKELKFSVSPYYCK